MELDLTDNGLTGQLPKEWALPPRLRRFSLGMNFLTGPLQPYALPDTVQYFSVGTNKLSGELPANWTLPASLDVMTLDANAFSGKVPSWDLPSNLR